MSNLDRTRLIGAIIYTTITTLFFGSVCVAIFFLEIPQGMQTIASILFGALVVCFKDCGSFWTGSTASSQASTAAIVKAGETAAAALVDTAKAAAEKVP